MKKILSTTVIALTLFSSSVAAAKTVTIDWTMSDTSNVTGYKMYYSTNSDMSAKAFACETTAAEVTSLTCEDIIIESYPLYFTITAITTEGEKVSSVKEYILDPPPEITKLSPVQNFSLINPNETWNIEDDFSSLDPWTTLSTSSSMTVSGNKGTVSNTWSSSLQGYSAVALTSLDQTAQVTVELGGATNKGGVLLRYDPAAGSYYTCAIMGDRAYINFYKGTTKEYLAQVTGLSFSTISPVTVSCTIIDNTITLFVDGAEYLNKIHSSTPSVGNYVGAYVGNDGSNAYISQLKAKVE